MENISFVEYFIDKNKRLFLTMTVLLCCRLFGQFLLTYYNYPALRFFVWFLTPMVDVTPLKRFLPLCFISYLFLMYMSYLGRNLVPDDSVQ